MSDSIEPTSSSASASETTGASAPVKETDLKQDVATLTALVLKLQSFMVAMTLIAGIYIGTNWWVSKQDLAAARQLTVAARQMDGAVSQFVSQLLEYGRTHPDFAQILSKYPIQAPQPGAAPAPAPGGAAPKPVTPAPAGQPKR